MIYITCMPMRMEDNSVRSFHPGGPLPQLSSPHEYSSTDHRRVQGPCLRRSGCVITRRGHPVPSPHDKATRDNNGNQYCRHMWRHTPKCLLVFVGLSPGISPLSGNGHIQKGHPPLYLSSCPILVFFLRRKSR